MRSRIITATLRCTPSTPKKRQAQSQKAQEPELFEAQWRAVPDEARPPAGQDAARLPTESDAAPAQSDAHEASSLLQLPCRAPCSGAASPRFLRRWQELTP